MAIQRVDCGHQTSFWLSGVQRVDPQTVSSIACVLTPNPYQKNYFTSIELDINLDNPQEGCDLNYVPHETLDKDIKIAVSNSFGFGGTNASLIFKKVN